ncbi:MAG: glycosyltransferase family 4 protein [Thermodesulfovibrionales bacterium]
MNIAIVRKKYTFHGGAESFSQELIKKLIKEGHKVHIYAIKWDTFEKPNNLYLHKIPAITFNSFLRDLSFVLSSYIKLRNQQNFDIIQSHDKTLFQDVYRAGDGCHIEWLKQRWKRTGPMGKLSIILNPYHWLILTLERLIFKGHRFKKIIAISELVKRNIIEHYQVDESDIEVIYNGIDLERFHPVNKERFRNEIRMSYSINEDDFVVLFVGSGFERKGVEYLVKSVELIPERLTVIVVGKGSENKIKKYIKKQRIIFCGPQREIHKYYAASDIFVFPTIYEPFGNVHLEALASGLPVITTKLSGASEIIKDGIQGFVIDKPEDIDMIAEKIRVLMNKDKNMKMGLEARRLAENFSFDTHVKKTMNFYEAIISTY